TFLLASRNGLEAVEAEQRYQRNQKEEAQYRTAALDFAHSLQNRAYVIDQNVALVALNAAEEIGRGPNPERSGSMATGILRNLAITVATAAALGTVSADAIASGSSILMALAGAATLVATDGLRKSKPFAALSMIVSEGINRSAATEL